MSLVHAQSLHGCRRFGRVCGKEVGEEFSIDIAYGIGYKSSICVLIVVSAWKRAHVFEHSQITRGIIDEAQSARVCVWSGSSGGGECRAVSGESGRPNAVAGFGEATALDRGAPEAVGLCDCG